MRFIGTAYWNQFVGLEKPTSETAEGVSALLDGQSRILKHLGKISNALATHHELVDLLKSIKDSMKKTAGPAPQLPNKELAQLSDKIVIAIRLLDTVNTGLENLPDLFDGMKEMMPTNKDAGMGSGSASGKGKGNGKGKEKEVIGELNCRSFHMTLGMRLADLLCEKTNINTPARARTWG